MKNILIIIFLSGILSANLHAQVNYLPSDSLLQWFENSNHPFDVWDSVRAWELRNNRTLYDYESYYQTPSLKPHLLKWLDRDLYYQRHLEELRESYLPDNKEDSAYMTYKIKGRLKQQKSKLSIDTILNTPKLYTLYTDSILSDIIELQKKEFEEKGKPFPDNRAISFHMNLAYPESYQQIKSFWEETGKGTERNSYFISLVRMGDPEARKIFDKQIKEVVRTNGRDVFLNSLLSTLGGELRGSYGTAKFIELLKVEQEIEIFAEGDVSGDFNCEVLDYLISDIFTYNIKVDPVIKYHDPCEKHLEHLLEIKEAAQRLIEYYKEQEYYWMSRMPFYEE